ncbi:MAG: glycosyltransferase [Rhodospirillales bacterium]
MNIAAVIPSFDHYRKLPYIVETLIEAGIAVFIIDDGSAEPARSALKALGSRERNITVVRCESNRGKGAAVMTGLRQAAAAGYSHAVQIDADGQHDLSALPALIRCATDNPTALVSGLPAYDSSIPLSRKIGRWVTHVWVWIETLSFQIKDSMCGFRVYPLAPILQLAAEETLGARMTFDTEVMVRHYWRGGSVIHVPVRVTYPEGNHSNFDTVRDNVAISWMHTRLFFSMLARLPSLCRRRRDRAEKTEHWSRVRERGIYAGLWFLAVVYRYLGHRICCWVMTPVIAYFWATGKTQRAASRQFLRRALSHPVGPRYVFRHMRSFGERTLRIFGAWQGNRDTVFDYTHAPTLLSDVNARSGRVLIVSHSGNVEVLRANLPEDIRARVTVLVHTRHAAHFNGVLRRFRPEAAMRALEVTDIGPDTVIELSERVARGEWIAIAGDRTPVGGDQRTSVASFLGQDARFPQGPYILAGLLECPLYMLFCMNVADTNAYTVYFEELAARVALPPGKAKQTTIDALAARYARRLEELARCYPYQWYNFFDFWNQRDSE